MSKAAHAPDFIPDPPHWFETPMIDALPRSPEGLNHLDPWFDESTGKVTYKRGEDN